MALVGLSLSPEVSKELSKIKVPGKKSKPETMHVTMFYLGKEVDLKDATKCLIESAEVCKKINPFNYFYKSITCFPENPDDGYPIICPIDSPELMSFRKKLKKQYDEKKVKYSNKFPQYLPHTTLSYHKKEIEDFDIEPIKVEVTHLSIWVSDNQDQDGIRIQIPLGKIKKSNMELISELFLKLA
jgi:2'-5' RNA ligase